MTVGYIDLGLARDADDTCPKHIAGSLPFIAPEVLLNKASDYRCDIYGLGRSVSLLWGIDITLFERSEMAGPQFGKKLRLV